MHARLAAKDAAKAIAKYGENDNEKFKLLDLALRTLAQLKAEEGLGVIEEVDEEDGRVRGVEGASQEVEDKDDLKAKENDDQEVKEKYHPKVEKGGKEI